MAGIRKAAMRVRCRGMTTRATGCGMGGVRCRLEAIWRPLCGGWRWSIGVRVGVLLRMSCTRPEAGRIAKIRPFLNPEQQHKFEAMLDQMRGRMVEKMASEAASKLERAAKQDADELKKELERAWQAR